MTSDVGDLEHGALDDLAFRDVAEAVIVDVEQLGVFGRVLRVGVELVTGLHSGPGWPVRLTSFLLELRG